MTSQPEKKTTTIHILPNIVIIKAIAIKLGQLKEYNMRKFFLKNHIQNVVENLFPDSFLKN